MGLVCVKLFKHKIWIILQNIKARKKFDNDMEKYRELLNGEHLSDSFPLEKDCLMPMLEDAYKEAGNLDRHYFFQDISMAQKINAASPNVHYDIGSRVDGFIAHLLSSSSVKKIVLIDVRPLSVHIPRVEFVQADAMTLIGIKNESIESLSSLSAIEHFGLGRYGDEIDPDGWKKALKQIQKKIKAGGYFYLSVPVGPRNKLVFNAHRIFAPSTIIKTLNNMELVSFDYIHDMEVINVKSTKWDEIDGLVSEFDCGLFVFIKK